MAQELMAKSPIPLPLQYVMLCLGLAISILSAIFMLRAANWARLLYIGWSGIEFLVLLLTSPVKPMLIPGILMYNEIYLELLGREHEKVGREPRPVGIGAHLEKNRRTRGLARGSPRQNAQAHQGSRPGRRRGVQVDGHSDLVARRNHLHWRILQECREAYLLQRRVSEGSGPSLQLESRRKRTPRDRHPRRRRS